MSTSYPFLSIARQFGVPYNATLLFADRVDALWNRQPTTVWHRWAWRQVNMVLVTPAALRAFTMRINEARENHQRMRRGEIDMNGNPRAT